MVTSLKRPVVWGGVPRGSCPRVCPLHRRPSALPTRPVSAPSDSVTARTRPTSSPWPLLYHLSQGCTPTVADAQSVDAGWLCRALAEQDSRRVKTQCQGCGSPVLSRRLPWTPSPISGPQGPAGISAPNPTLSSHSRLGARHSPGNWGHLDQVAALHWVQGEHCQLWRIQAGSVTIFGESAGAESVSVLVRSLPGPDVAADGTLADPAHLVLGPLLPRPGFKVDLTLCSIQMVEI